MRYFYYLCIFLTFLGKTAAAQEQITNFENQEITFPTNLGFVDTLDNYVYFTAQTKIFDKPVLWISDGTTAGTHPIRDANGNFIYSINTKVVFNNKLYVYASELQQLYSLTDSTTTEIALEDPASPVVHLQAFGDSLVVMQYVSYRNYSVEFINTTDQYTLFQSNIQYFIAEKDVLFWVKDDTENKTSLLYRMDDNSVSTYYTFDKIYNFLSNNFQHYTLFGYDYFYLSLEFNEYLLSINPQNPQKANFRNWGKGYELNYLAKIVYDEERNPYLHKHTDDFVEIYQVFPNDSLNLVAKPLYNKIILSPYSYQENSGEYLFYIGKEKDEFYFISSYCVEGCLGFYLTIYSSNNDEYNRTRQGSSKVWITKPIVSKIDSNSYNVKTYESITYNFQTQKWTLDSTFQTTPPIPNDYSFFLKNKQFLLADNLYLLSRNQKIPLITSQKGGSINNYHNFFTATLVNKMLFWTSTYNPKSTRFDINLYANNGSDKASQLLLTFENSDSEIVYTTFKEKFYFYSFSFIDINKTLYKTAFYETDGTKEGTKRLFETGQISPYTLSFQKSNNLIVFPFYHEEKWGYQYIQDKDYFLNTQAEYAIPFSFVLTEKALFIQPQSLNRLDLVESGNIQKSFLSFNQLQTYKNKLYYIKDKDLYFTQNGKDINVLDNNIEFSNFQIYGNWLLADTTIYNLKLNKKYSKFSLNIPNRNSVFYTKIPYRDELILYAKNYLIILRENSFINKIFDDYEIYDVYPQPTGYWFKKNSSENPFVFMNREGDEKIITDRVYDMLRYMNYDGYLRLFRDDSSNFYKWNYKNQQIEKLYYLPLAHFYLIDKSNILIKNIADNGTSRSNYSFFHFNGNEIVEKYKLENFRYNDYQNNGFFGTAYRPNKGYELAQIGADSLAFFPEIVKGDEGIILGKAFVFKNSAYAYCYTPTHGWQVWKMGALPTVSPADSTIKISPELLVSEILANEPTPSPNITVYPNPSSDFIQIETEQIYEYRLVGEKGEIIIENNTNHEPKISLKNLSTGSYILQVYSDTFSKSYKIIKKE